MAIPEFLDAQISFSKLMFESGSVTESESYIVSALYRGTIFAAPFRVIQPLNVLYFLKFRTINDKDKLKGLGAMIALLLGVRYIIKLKSFKFPISYCRRSQILKIMLNRFLDIEVIC